MTSSHTQVTEPTELNKDFYRTLYEDIQNLNDRQATRHWEETGCFEGRFGSEAQLLVRAAELGVDAGDFSTVQYLALNPDLPEELLIGKRALHHFVTVGHAEGRLCRIMEWRDVEVDRILADYLASWVDPVAPRDEIEQLVHLHALIKGRVPLMTSIDSWRNEIQEQSLDAVSLIKALAREEVVHRHHRFQRCASDEHRRAAPGSQLSGSVVSLFGVSESVELHDWARRRDGYRASQTPVEAGPVTTVGTTEAPADQPAVAVISSLYGAEEFLDRFLDNLVEQDIAATDCEFVMVAVCPSEFARERLEWFASRLPRVRVIEVVERISIYEAWNIAIRCTTAPFITNANADDFRRADSLRRQRDQLLENVDVDVVFQDYLVSLDPIENWREVESIGYATDLPAASVESIMDVNSPHCAPMWRRELHDQVGYFNPHLESAGDHEFWMRCLLAGRRFRKDPVAHAAYFQNPLGMSTREDSPANAEGENLREWFWWTAREMGLL